MVYIDSLTIKKDTFLYTKDYANYEKYKKVKLKIFDFTKLGKKLNLSEDEIENYIADNPNLYTVYWTLGDYFYKKKDIKNALKYYKLALTKDIASLAERNAIESTIKKLEME